MGTYDQSSAFTDLTEDELRDVLDSTDYIAEDDIVTTVLLSLRLGKPLLVEGEPGSGKTELGKVLAEGFDTELIRLQCYEGLAPENALFEWNYTKQLLSVQADERGVTEGETVFDEEYLLERPLLRALSQEGETPPVLLIDEIDRADEEFEALLLEILSDFQVSIPEYGTVRAATPPVVIITSNRTRGLSDALKRRCLFYHVETPSFEKERAIVRRKVPGLDDALIDELVGVAQRLREETLLKQPGVAETLDWARAVGELSENGNEKLSRAELEHTLGFLLKEVEDTNRVDDDLVDSLLAAGEDARNAGG
ncbi:AAA family ATPase (plasmid) [Natrialbaceae archaeon A-arb3/5]